MSDLVKQLNSNQSNLNVVYILHSCVCRIFRIDKVHYKKRIVYIDCSCAHTI